jgi:predicted RNase H-like HicB family nuclease
MMVAQELEIFQGPGNTYLTAGTAVRPWSFVDRTAFSAVGLAGIIQVLDREDEKQDLAELRCSFVRIDNLGDCGLRLIRPIVARAYKEDGAFVISFEDANVNAGGETMTDAIDMFKDAIVFTFKFLSKKEPILDERLKGCFEVLEQHVQAC